MAIRILLTYEDKIARVIDTNTPGWCVDIKWGEIHDFPRSPSGLIDPLVFENHLLKLAAGILRWKIQRDTERVFDAGQVVEAKIQRHPKSE